LRRSKIKLPYGQSAILQTTDWRYTPNEPCFLDRKGGSKAVTARGKAKLARVVAIQKIALKFIGRNGRWDRLNDGPEVMKYQDAAFLMMFYVGDPVPANHAGSSISATLSWPLWPGSVG
jgi:hypothetical protein